MRENGHLRQGGVGLPQDLAAFLPHPVPLPLGEEGRQSVHLSLERGCERSITRSQPRRSEALRLVFDTAALHAVPPTFASLRLCALAFNASTHDGPPNCDAEVGRVCPQRAARPFGRQTGALRTARPTANGLLVGLDGLSRHAIAEDSEANVNASWVNQLSS
jgi:hypothetical protein